MVRASTVSSSRSCADTIEAITREIPSALINVISAGIGEKERRRRPGPRYLIWLIIASYDFFRQNRWLCLPSNPASGHWHEAGRSHAHDLHVIHPRVNFERAKLGLDQPRGKLGSVRTRGRQGSNLTMVIKRKKFATSRSFKRSTNRGGGCTHPKTRSGPILAFNQGFSVTIFVLAKGPLIAIAGDNRLRPRAYPPMIRARHHDIHMSLTLTMSCLRVYCLPPSLVRQVRTKNDLHVIHSPLGSSGNFPDHGHGEPPNLVAC